MDTEFKVHHTPSLLRKAGYWMEKMRWGLKNIGIAPLLKGVTTLGYLHIRRPRRAEFRLSSGQVLEFGFPNQLPRALLVFGQYVDPEFAFLSRIARPEWIVADIGAAIGQFTIFAATLPVASVHAFEPSTANVAALRSNVARNGVADRVKIHELALSKDESEAYFETTASTWVSRLSNDGNELVSVRTLDAEFERLGLEHISILKVNVAGFEPQVMEGAQKFLSEGRADILILLLGLPSLVWYERIADLGYRFFYYHPKENALYGVAAFDADSVLEHRPWPARHIIAIQKSIINRLIGDMQIIPIATGSLTTEQPRPWL